MDFFGLLAVQGTLKSLFQHRKFESLKASILSLPYGPLSTFSYYKKDLHT